MAAILIILLSIVVLFLILTFVKIRDLNNEIKIKNSEIEIEKSKRRNYESALGISVVSDQAAVQDLWVRAHHGDEFAERVLASRMNTAVDTLHEPGGFDLK